MQDAFLHRISEEVSRLNLNAIFCLAALLWNWRVFDILESTHDVFLIVGHLLGWPEIHLVAAYLGVAVFDKGTFTRL